MDVGSDWTTDYMSSYPDDRHTYSGHALPSAILINGTTAAPGREGPPGGGGGADRLPGLPFLRQEGWTVPLLAASATNTAAILAFEVYIIARALHGTPSRRHLFLGQCLLLGLLLCSLSGLPLALEPSALSCAAVRLSATISPALVFGALLVKCVFLISLNSGVYLPAHYQALLLFFVVLVQVSISIQWLSSAPGEVISYTTEGGRAAALCTAPYRHTLLALLYVMVLMLAVAVLAIKCRGFRENYRESSYIGASIGVCLPLWVSWTLAGLMLPDRLQPACVGFGIVTTASVVFLIMFIPKGRQMAAVGKDGLYREDREDRLSTVSAARYSPSFFLFKPIKTEKEIQRQNNSFYKSPPSGMFGYGVLPPHNPPPPTFPHHPPSTSPFSAPSFKAVHRSTPQPLYSGLRHKSSLYTSLQAPATSSTYQTPPYSVLRHKTAHPPATMQDRRRPRRSKTSQPVLRQCTPIYWPQIHANGHGLFHKGNIAKTPGEPVYLARYLH